MLAGRVFPEAEIFRVPDDAGEEPGRQARGIEVGVARAGVARIAARRRAGVAKDFSGVFGREVRRRVARPVAVGRRNEIAEIGPDRVERRHDREIRHRRDRGTRRIGHRTRRQIARVRHPLLRVVRAADRHRAQGAHVVVVADAGFRALREDRLVHVKRFGRRLRGIGIALRVRKEAGPILRHLDELEGQRRGCRDRRRQRRRDLRGPDIAGVENAVDQRPRRDVLAVCQDRAALGGDRFGGVQNALILSKIEIREHQLPGGRRDRREHLVRAARAVGRVVHRPPGRPGLAAVVRHGEDDPRVARRVLRRSVARESALGPRDHRLPRRKHRHRRHGVGAERRARAGLVEGVDRVRDRGRLPERLAAVGGRHHPDGVRLPELADLAPRDIDGAVARGDRNRDALRRFLARADRLDGETLAAIRGAPEHDPRGAGGALAVEARECGEIGRRGRRRSPKRSTSTDAACWPPTVRAIVGAAPISGISEKTAVT